MTREDKLERFACSGLAFGALCFTGAMGFVVGTLWLSPPVGGRVEVVDPPSKRATGAIPGEQSRKQALYEAIRDEESDLTASEPDPFHWKSNPEGARRVLDRIQAERKVLEDKARKLRVP